MRMKIAGYQSVSLFLVLILLSQWILIAFFINTRNLKDSIQWKPILKYSKVFCRFYSYLMDCSFASNFSD